MPRIRHRIAVQLRRIANRLDPALHQPNPYTATTAPTTALITAIRQAKHRYERMNGPGSW